MTSSTDFDRLVASWLLAAGPADVDRSVVDDALGAAGRTGQRRRPWPLGPAAWPRTHGRASTIRLLALGAAVLLAAGAVVGLGAAALDATVPAPTAVVAPSPGVVPPASPAASAAADAGVEKLAPLPRELRGSWIRDVPDGWSFFMPSGAARMTLEVDEDGRRLLVTVSSRPGGALMPSEVGLDAGGHVVVRSERAIEPSRSDPEGDAISIDGDVKAGCTAGDDGAYNWDLSSPTLQFAVRSDACESRGFALAGAWVRSLDGPSPGGQGLVTVGAGLGPLVGLWLPTDSGWTGRSEGLGDAEFRSDDGQRIVRIWVDPIAFADACDESSLLIAQSAGARAFAAAVARTAGLRATASEEEAISTTDRTVMHLEVDVAPAASCWTGSPGVAAWQARDDLGAGGEPVRLERGAPRELHVVDAWSARVLLVELLGIDAATRARILESLHAPRGTDAYSTPDMNFTP